MNAKSLVHTLRVADEPDGLAGALEGFDQGDRVLGIGQIPHRAMAAWVKNGVKVGLLHAAKLDGLGQRLLGVGVCLEAVGHFCLEVRQITLGVERGLAAGWAG